jgi:hypothetical protein
VKHTVARALRERLRLADAVAPGSLKNMAEGYKTVRESKGREKEAGDALVAFCTKLAFSAGSFAPRVPTPRVGLGKPGGSMSVGRWEPNKGFANRSPPAIGAKGVNTAAASVVNPNRSVMQAQVAQTSMKEARP